MSFRINKLVFTSLIFFLIAVLFNYFTFRNILFKVYTWHLQQPETIQGGMELIVLYIFIYIMFVLITNRSIFLGLMILLVGIYLKLHQVLLPTITSVIYFECLIIIGSSLYKLLKFKKNEGISKYLNYFVIGIIVWSIIAMFFSLLGFGTFNYLRIVTIILTVIALFARGKNQDMPFALIMLLKIRELKVSEAVGVFFVLLMLLVQLAKTNTALDYDSIWYGLRPELVLVGKHSFYDNLGMVMYVHYYPKLLELLLIPISNLGDYSFILSGNIYILGVLLVVIYLFTRNYTTKINSILCTSLAASIPALINMGSTAKTDIFTTLLIILAAYYFWIWYQSLDNYSIYLSFVCSILSFGGKITSFLYIPLLFFGLFLFLLLNRRLKLLKNINISHLNNNIIMGGSIIVLLGLSYRTFKLTGYPFYPLLGGLWSIMGFEVKYPFRTDTTDLILNEQKVNMFLHWSNIFFNPGSYSHYVMVWPGNIVLFAGLLYFFILFSNRKKLDAYKQITILISLLPITVSSIYYISNFPQGGDGNYYLPPLILILIISLPFILTNTSGFFKKTVCTCLILFIFSQTVLAFVSHFSWSWGTSSFSTDLFKNEFESSATKLNKFKQMGLLEVEQYIQQDRQISNCTGFGDEQLLNQLSCRFEDIPHIVSRYGNSKIISSKGDFLEYLRWSNSRYIILPKQKIEGYDYVYAVINDLKKEVIEISSDQFYLIDLQKKADNSSSSQHDNYKLINGWYDQENGYRWVAKSSEGLFKSGSKGKAQITGIVPDLYKQVEVEIFIDNELKLVKNIESGPFVLELKVPPDSEVNIKIQLNKSFVPKNNNINNDQRELGIIITRILME